MDLVVDANVLFSVIIKKGRTEELLFIEDLHLFAPEFLFQEFENYKELIVEKTNRTYDDFEDVIIILRKKIKTIPNEEIESFIPIAKEICPDPKDVDYFALALKLNCGIWSNDKVLKQQNKVQIYSTAEIMKIY
jgi:predicted nucleic acid-binding protein